MKWARFLYIAAALVVANAMMACWTLGGSTDGLKQSEGKLQTTEETGLREAVPWRGGRSTDWSGEDSEALMQIAAAELPEGEVQRKALIMRLVLNRVWSEDYPGSIREVIFQPGEFQSVMDGRYFEAVPDESCIEALRLVQDGWDESSGALTTTIDEKHQTFVFRADGLEYYK